MANRYEVPAIPLAIRRVEVLQGVLITRIFNIVMEWSGFTGQNLANLLREPLPDVEGNLTSLADAGLLNPIPVWELSDGTLVSREQPRPDQESPVVRQFHMYYGSDTAAIYVEHRDGISLRRIRDRIHEDIRGDHNDDRPKLRHTLRLNDCVVALTLGEFKPFAGYRAVKHMPGGTQLVPDAWMLVRVDVPLGGDAGERPFTPPVLFVEYERSAHTVAGVRRKLRKYVRAATEGFPTSVLFICETEVAMHIFRQEHQNLQRENNVVFSLLTTAYTEVVAGIRTGVALNMNGEPVTVWTGGARDWF